MRYDYLIIGGGISGAAVGYALADHASVVILEAETTAGYHSTGRSAALFTRNFGGHVVRRINAVSQSFFLAPPDGFCDHPLLTPRGALTVATRQCTAELEPLLALSTPKEKVERISREEALAMVPFLRPDRVAEAIFEPGVTDIDVALLQQSFLRGLKARGGELQTGQRVASLTQDGGGWVATTDKGSFEARIIINAAGAWADQIGAMAGATKIGLVPRRRTAIIVDPPASLDVRAFPAVDFAGTDAYIKPDAGMLMASLGDATPDEPQDVRPDEMDIAILADWIQRETRVPVRRIAHSWAGLRSFVHDGAPVVGFDPEAPGFFWLAGQGGYGIMMAPALGEAAAALCTDGKLPAHLVDAGLSADALSPVRPLSR